MPSRFAIEQERARRARAEEAILAELIPGGGPANNDYDPETGDYYYTRSPREYDAAAVAPMGEVPNVPRNDPAADQKQDLIDHQELLAQQLAEDERARARYAQTPIGPPAPPRIGEAPPPNAIMETFREPEAAAETPASRYAESMQAVQAAMPIPPPSPPVPAAETEKSITPEVSRGAQPDIYGHDDEAVFSRARAIRDAGTAYDAATLTRQNPYDPEYTERENPFGGHAPTDRWEDEFLKQHSRLSDDQIRRRSAVIGLFSGLFTGDTSAGDRWARGQRETGLLYDRGLAEARGRDKGERRIDKGLAEAIAATGNISPDEAARLTYNSPLVASYQNGMYAQGLSSERADKLYQQFQLGELGKTARGREAAASDERQTAMRVAAQLASASAYAQRRGQTTPSADEQARGVQANLQLSGIALSEDAARRIAYEDDYSAVPEADRERVRAMTSQARQLATTYKGLDDLAKARIDDPRGVVRTEQAADLALRKAQQDPKYAIEFQNDWEDSADAFREAYAGWNGLSPRSQQNFVAWGRGGFVSDQLSKFLAEPGDQEVFAKLQRVINPMVRNFAGVGQTGGEIQRIGQEIGIASGDFRPLNSPGVVTEWLEYTGRALTRHRQTYESNVGGWKGRQ